LTSELLHRSADPGEAEVAYSAGGSLPPLVLFLPPFLLSRVAKGMSQTLGVFRGVRFPAMTHDFSDFAGADRISGHPEALTDRLLSPLRKKPLIRQGRPTLIIRDRTALEALTG
jgi:hypothetical protein